jgi:hypothetical protein
LDDGTELILERVASVMERDRAKLKRDPFSLYFRGSPERVMPQQIYRFQHGAFPADLEIFIVPVGRTTEGVQYEAVFT